MRAVAERRNSPLAPQHVLDVCRLVLTLWMIGQFQWTYYEVYLHRPLPDMYPGDIIFFLCGIPLMAALALRPHLKRSEIQLRFGYIDFILLLAWWIFLYAFVVLPWMYAEPSLGQYNVTFDWINTIQSMVIVVGFGVLWLRSHGTWRMVYANLFGCQALHMLSTLMINVAIDLKVYHTGDLYDLPLVASFLWFGAAGVVAYQNSASLDDSSEPSLGEGADRKKGESILASRLAMAAVVSLPVFAVYTIKFGHDSPAVREFRQWPSCLPPFRWAFWYSCAITWRIAIAHGCWPAPSSPSKICSVSRPSWYRLRSWCLSVNWPQAQPMKLIIRLPRSLAIPICLRTILHFPKGPGHFGQNPRSGSPHENACG
jgi:hypothetical protein